MEDFRKLSRGEKIAGISAALLFVFMFFSWFGTEVSGPSGSVDLGSSGGGNAWESLDFIPVVLLATVVATLLGICLRLGDFDVSPVTTNAVIAVLGAVSTLLILYRIVDPPSFGEVGELSLDATLGPGIFLGLFASAGIAFGSFTAMRGEGGSAKTTAPAGGPTQP
jgi:hypothetical protein